MSGWPVMEYNDFRHKAARVKGLVDLSRHKGTVRDTISALKLWGKDIDRHHGKYVPRPKHVLLAYPDIANQAVSYDPKDLSANLATLTVKRNMLQVAGDVEDITALTVILSYLLRLVPDVSVWRLDYVVKKVEWHQHVDITPDCRTYYTE